MAVGGIGLGLAACSSVTPVADAPADATSTASTSAPAGAPAAGLAFDKDFGKDGISLLALAASGNDRLYTATPGPDGKTYAAGFIADGGDQSLAVVRIDASGKLDKSFGKDGVASVNVAIGGKTLEVARGLAIQSDGRIVIAGPVEHDVAATGDAARDTDVALARFDISGKIDTTFGKSGVAVVDFGTGRATSATAFIADNSWGLVSVAGDRLVLWGSTPAPGADRTDSDYVAVGLTPAGVVDTAFGTDGTFTVDITSSGDSPRNMLAQPDGKIVATGYSNIGGVVQPVMVRFSATGVLDKEFGTGGVATTKILDGVTESYNVTMQGDKYILAGYGRGADSSEKVDLVMERYNADGSWDKTFGTDGLLRVDIAKEDDRARNVIVLPDGRILAAGSGKKTATDIDAMLVLVTKDGQLDASFGDGGIMITDLGGPGDAWYGLTLSADKKSVIVAGYKGADANSGGNDDAVVGRLLL